MARLRKQGTSHRIAVIDDDADLRASTRALLANDGHEVETAADPESGIALIRSWRPQLVLLDYYMEGGTGADVVREVRTFDEHLQVLLVTGYAAEQPGRKLMRELDIQGYHNKSDGAERLLVLVDGALKHFRAIDQLNTQRGYLQRILEAAPLVNRLQPAPELLRAALQQFSAIVGGGDGFIAASNNGLFVLGDADARINIHAGTGKYGHVHGLTDLPAQLAPVVTAGIAAKEPFYDACGLLVVPLETRDGDRGCMLLECARMPHGASDPCMLFAKQVVQSW